MRRLAGVLQAVVGTSLAVACGLQEPWSPQSVVLSGEDWRVGDTTFVIGSLAGAEEQLLYIPRRPQFAGGDSVSVLNGLTEIRVYERNGHLVRTVGREGQGPGEWAYAYWYDRTDERGFVVLDQQRIVMLLDVDGQETYRRVLEPAHDVNVRAGALSDGRIVGLSRGTPEEVPNEWVRDSVDLWVSDPRSEEPVTVLDRVPGSGRWVGRPGWRHTLPLAPRPTLAASAGLIAYSDGVEYTLSLYDDTGRKRVLRLERDAVPLEPEHVEAWVKQQERLFEERGAPPDTHVLPADLEPPVRPTLPAWAGLLFDDLGCLWARQSPLPGASGEIWDVIDPRGHHLAVVSLPTGFRLEGVRGNELIGLGEDYLGVEYVVGRSLDSERDRAGCSSPFPPGM